MAIIGSDNRLPVSDFTIFPLNAVVAVDALKDFSRPPEDREENELIGSGITIAPYSLSTVRV
jgi:hypothetical protein